jgi:pyruvate dehydrogenase E2 component (dihydrolipoamide acetyltransferase)
MAYSWSTVPQVTQFDKADVTDVERLRKQYGKRVEQAGAKLTLTAIIVKVLPAALKRFPQVNSSIDIENDELIHKRYYHIGVAVDTDRGLLVPVIRDADKKSITDIAVELGEMAERARNRKTSLDEMQGGTFTVSNLGGIGGTAFTPIVYSPQAAILGVARSVTEPVWDDDRREFVPRLMMPVSLSYDHRVIDGADGARFLRYVCELLEQPFLAMLE